MSEEKIMNVAVLGSDLDPGFNFIPINEFKFKNETLVIKVNDKVVGIAFYDESVIGSNDEWTLIYKPESEAVYFGELAFKEAAKAYAKELIGKK